MTTDASTPPPPRRLRHAQWLIPIGLSLLAIVFEGTEPYIFPSAQGFGEAGFWLEIGFFAFVMPTLVALILRGIIRAGEQLEAARRETERLYIALQEKEAARRALLGAVIDAQEAERKRIARALHDQLGQELSAFVYSAESAQSGGGDHAEAVRHMHQTAMQVLETTRQMIFDLRPPALDERGLGPALRRLAEEMPGLAAVKLTLTDRLSGRLPPEVEIALFRIAQEALSNVARHAAARGVTIELGLTNGRAVLQVKDDGVGFAPQTFLPGRRDLSGLGLLGMEERAALLGGEVKIVSQVGAGTEVTAAIPLEGL
jgi:signal transduction histidine kinase